MDAPETDTQKTDREETAQDAGQETTGPETTGLQTTGLQTTGPETAPGAGPGTGSGIGPTRLSPAQEAQTREALGEGRFEPTIRAMSDIFFGRGPGPAEGRATAEALGWIDPATGGFTELGRFAADSCREHLLWRERGGMLPFDQRGAPVSSQDFAGKDTLEIGCGMGVNLMSLADLPGRRIGVDPIPAYRQFGDIFREVEGLAPVTILQGSGEAIPVAAESADIVLCVTAHQYMDLRQALAEMARALRPGGELVLLGSTLGLFVRDVLPAPQRTDAIALVNTLGYMAFGRRPIPARGPSATSRPIYPTEASLIRLLRAAGLEIVRPPSPVGPERGFFARKPRR